MKATAPTPRIPLPYAILVLCFIVSAGAAAQDISALEKTVEPDSEQPDTSIAIESDPTADRAIEHRLREIFASVSGLEAVDVSASSGVVTLAGVADSSDVVNEAGNLARRLEGVVAVENQLELDRKLVNRLTLSKGRLESSLARFISILPSIAVALLFIVLSWVLARLLTSWDGLFDRLAPNPFVSNLIRQFVRSVVVIAGVVLALELLNATALLGSIAGALGIIGLAVGFATRDTVENYIASILLSLRQPFAPRDHVCIEDQEGIVVRLNSRATILMSMDGNHIRIPNAVVYKSKITNFTANPLRRFEFEVGVDTDIELAHPRKLALECLEAMPGILSDPPPQCLVSELGDSSVVLKMLAWVDQRAADFVKVRSEALQVIKETFDQTGIVMPEPIYNVNLRRRPAQQREAATAARTDAPDVHDMEIGPDQTIQKQIDIDVANSDEENLLDTSRASE